MRLGGLTIEHDRHLIGHSDADVLLHAITDALLGALAQGDIGTLFPDSDPAYHQADSKQFLLEALRRTRAGGYRVGNLDCTVFAERPRLQPYREPICRQLAEWLQVDPSAVSIKAKTGEGVGSIGRQEAIAAEAVVLLVPARDG